MACKCAPALLQLTREFNALFPHRDTESDGCCGDAAHQARKSDHNADASGYAHAKDFDEDLIAGMGDRQLWEFAIILLADNRTKQIIYERQTLYPDGTIRRYTGINAHEHHMHLGIKPGAHNDIRPWLTGTGRIITPGPPAPLPPGLEDPTMPGRDKLDSQKGALRAVWRATMLRGFKNQAEFDYHLAEFQRRGYEAYVQWLVEVSPEGKEVLAAERLKVLGRT